MSIKRARVWILLLVAVVGAQIAVPAIALVQPKPARFGFQMYSGHDGGTIEVLGSAGRALHVDLAALLPRPLRPELDWRVHIPEHFCRSIAGAELIVIDQALTGRTEVPCD